MNVAMESFICARHKIVVAYCIIMYFADKIIHKLEALQGVRIYFSLLTSTRTNYFDYRFPLVFKREL